MTDNALAKSAGVPDLETIFERYAGTFATRDPSAIVALHSENSVFVQHTDTEPAHGRAAIAAAFAATFRTWPELRFEVQRTMFGPDFWVLDWTLNAEVAGHTASFDCTDLVTLDAAGLVARKDTWVDLVQVNRVLARG